MSIKEPRRIFAYGSLMWRPDFKFVQMRPARLVGYHRRLCLFSNHYRGTDEKPGLVLGLDRGGSCVGQVFDIAETDWAEVIAKVRQREMLGNVYHEVCTALSILNTDTRAQAITYVVRRNSPDYVPKMRVEELLHFINQGQGTMGSCRDYVAQTIRHLRQLGIHDAGLEVFASHVM